MVSWIVLALSTGLFVSYLPARFFRRTFWTGAGLLGSAWGWLLLPCLPTATLPCALFLLVAAGASIGITSLAEKALGRKDDPRIILDETVGYWVSAAFLPRTTGVLAAAFLLFRVFDVYKLPPLKAMQNWPRGWGVMADDIGAGILTNLILQMGVRWYG